jgi:hypothetical protein
MKFEEASQIEEPKEPWFINSLNLSFKIYNKILVIELVNLIVYSR